MPLYIVVDSAGVQQRVSTQPLAAGVGEELLYEAALDAEPSALTHAWNPTTRTYVPLVAEEAGPISRTRLTKREFLQRLDAAGALDQIDARLATPPEDATAIAIIAGLRKLDRYITVSDFIELTLPLVQAGVAQLVVLGYLTQAEADVVLAPSTVAEE